MSTRCNIIIRQRYYKDIYLYHHSDGGPACVGSVLFELCKKSNEKGLCLNNMTLANMLVKRGVTLVDKEGQIVKIDDKYEITSDIHGDIDYLYTIDILYDNVYGYTELSIMAYYVKDEDYKVNLDKKRAVIIPYSDDDPLHVQI